MKSVLLSLLSVNVLVGIAAQTFTIESGKPSNGINRCQGLLFCNQAFVRNNTKVIASGFITISSAGSDSNPAEQQAYLEAIGDEAVVRALQIAMDLEGSQPFVSLDTTCAVSSPGVWRQLEASGSAFGLSQGACEQFQLSLQNSILGAQSLRTQMHAYLIVIISLSCLVCVLCVAYILFRWLKKS